MGGMGIDRSGVTEPLVYRLRSSFQRKKFVRTSAAGVSKQMEEWRSHMSKAHNVQRKIIQAPAATEP